MGGVWDVYGTGKGRDGELDNLLTKTQTAAAADDGV